MKTKVKSKTKKELQKEYDNLGISFAIINYDEVNEIRVINQLEQAIKLNIGPDVNLLKEMLDEFRKKQSEKKIAKQPLLKHKEELEKLLKIK